MLDSHHGIEVPALGRIANIAVSIIDDVIISIVEREPVKVFDLACPFDLQISAHQFFNAGSKFERFNKAAKAPNGIHCNRINNLDCFSWLEDRD